MQDKFEVSYSGPYVAFSAFLAKDKKTACLFNNPASWN
jgi:hypothetical protein